MKPLRSELIRLAHGLDGGSRKALLDILAYENGDTETDGWNPGRVTPRSPWPEGTGSAMPPERDLQGLQKDKRDFKDNHFADRSASVPHDLRSLLKGEWVEVSSEPVVAIRFYRGLWGAIMRNGLVNSYTNEAKFVYQLKNSMQVPHREAERAWQELRNKVPSRTAGALTEQSVLDYLGGSQGFTPDSVTVFDLAQGFGGSAQQHTRMLQRMVSNGKLEYDSRSKGYSLRRASMRPALIRLAHSMRPGDERSSLLAVLAKL